MADDGDMEKGSAPVDGEASGGGHRGGGKIDMDTRYVRSLEGLMKLISLVSIDMGSMLSTVYLVARSPDDLLATRQVLF